MKKAQGSTRAPAAAWLSELANLLRQKEGVAILNQKPCILNQKVKPIVSLANGFKIQDTD